MDTQKNANLVLVVGDIGVDVPFVAALVTPHLRVARFSPAEDVGEGFPGCVALGDTSKALQAVGWEWVHTAVWETCPETHIVWCTQPLASNGVAHDYLPSPVGGPKHSTFHVDPNVYRASIDFANLLLWVYGVCINYDIPNAEVGADVSP